MIRSGTRRGATWLLVAVWAALTVGLFVSLRHLPWDRVLAEARHVQPFWLGCAVLANFFILPLWAIEWRLLSPVGVRARLTTMFEVVGVTAAVLNSIPFFAGEAAGVALLIIRAKLSRAAALAVLAMDQLLVGFAKLVVLAVAAWFTPLSSWIRGGFASLMLAVAVLLLLLLPLAHRGTAMGKHLRARPTPLGLALARVAAWGAQLETLRDPTRVCQVALLALMKKGAELAGIIAMQIAFGLDPSLPLALLVLAALSLTTMIPLTPANLGVYEGTVFAAYAYGGVAPEAAIGMAVLQHVAFLLPAIASGYLMLTLRQVRPERARPA